MNTALHRIDRLIVPVASDGVDHLNDRTIQPPQETARRILGQFDAAGCSESREVTIGTVNLFDSSGGSEIEAKTKRYHRANNEWVLDVRPAAFPGFAGEVKAAKRVGFPKIDPRTQPVIVVVALLERLAGKNSLAHSFLASVVAENETRSELMQQRTADYER